MEHSYSRDWRSSDDHSNISTRSIMIHRPPQCPSCHVHSHDEGVEIEDFYSPPIPSYNETAAKEGMNETENITKNVKNHNKEDIDWELIVNKLGWSTQQCQLFDRITQILNLDRLARYTHKDQQHEPVLRRVVIDKSVQRMRQALSSIHWDQKLTQFIHGVLMDYLPPSYLSAYLDILQSMKAKIPTLVDKMIFSRTNTHQELLKPVCKKPWEPIIDQKSRKLPNQPVILIVPSGPSSGHISPRHQKFYALFASMASVVPVQCHVLGLNKQGLPYITEQLMSVTRAKIQEIRAETANRPIILLGFNAGAALALQIAHVESVTCVVCMGFAYNTVHGVRGAPDDRILDITTPILFVIGQNSAKVSQEEMESMREKMQSHTSLVVVGSADDCLRVGKSKRKIEKVTQSMVDNMVMDEVAEFATMCLLNPPGPRIPTNTIPNPNVISTSNATVLSSNRLSVGKTIVNIRKRKITNSSEPDQVSPTKFKTIKVSLPRGRPTLVGKDRTPQTPLVNPTSEALDMAIQSILPSNENEAPLPKLVPTTPNSNSKIMTSYEIVPSGKSKLEIRQLLAGTPGSTIQSGTAGTPIMLPMIQRPIQNVKVIPPNQFLQLKPSLGTSQKVYTLNNMKSIVTRSPTQSTQIYTLKTAGSDNLTTQFRGNKMLTIRPAQSGSTSFVSNQNVNLSSLGLSGQKKITVMKTVTNTDHKSTPDLSSTNIFDMPIVFADSDGNIQESTHIPTSTPTSSPLLITSKSQLNQVGRIENTFTPINQVGNRSIVINNLLTNKNKQNKVVLINRNQIKGVPNLLRKNIPQLKYTKVVVTNPSTKIGESSTLATTAPTIMNSSAPKLISSTIIKPANSTTSSAFTSSAPTSQQKFQPIIINVDSDKSNTLKNIIKVGDTQIKPVNTILIKSGTGGIKQFPMLKPGFLNRNLTVKKIVNIVPPIKKPSVVGTEVSVNSTSSPTVTQKNISQTSDVNSK